jgi:acyl-CoA-binding protein
MVNPTHPPPTVQEAFQQTIQLLSSNSINGRDGDRSGESDGGDARDRGRSFRDTLTNDEQLQLYGYYKHATIGTSSIDSVKGAPNFWDVKEYRKYQAWKSCAATLSSEQAMTSYMEFVINKASHIEQHYQRFARGS